MMKNIHHILVIALIFLLAISCGTQRQLQKAFIGEPVSKLGEQFGAPTSVIDKENEKVYIFEKEEELKSTEINQGKLTLDPIRSPRVIKTERYYFTVINGVVTKAQYEEEYER